MKYPDKIKITLAVELGPIPTGDNPHWQAWCRDFFGDALIAIERDGTAEIDLTVPHLDAIAEKLEQLKAKDRLGRLGGKLTFTADDDPEWFILASMRSDGSLNSEITPDRLQTVKADRVPKGSHLRHSYRVVFSEDLKQDIVRQGFSGIDFLWVIDTGKTRAPQWFAAVPLRTFGHGFDHPWMDPSSRNHQYEPYGVTSLYGHRMKPDAGFGIADKDRLLRVIIPEYLSIDSPHRYPRTCEPDTDFANASGRLCCRKRVKEHLVAYGYAAERNFIAIEIEDESLPGIDTPSCSDPAAMRRVDLEAHARLKLLADRAYEEFLANPKPKKAATLAGSIKLLKAFKRKSEGEFGKPAKASAIAQAGATLPLPVPDAWKQVWQVANGFEIYDRNLNGHEDEIGIESTDNISGDHANLMASLLSGNPNFPAHYLMVAQAMCGDMIALDTSAIDTAGECPVVYISHETYSVHRAWATVADFLDDLLA